MNKKSFLLTTGAFMAAALLSADLSAQQRRFTEGLTERPFFHYPRFGFNPVLNGLHPIYRSYDGTNNNISHLKEEWGAGDIQLYREMPAVYGSTDPKNAMNGTTRPTARKISNVICDEPVTQFNSRNLSAFVYVWGQFVDHDITLTPQDTIEYYPVLLPPDETLFTLPIPFFRSTIRTGTGVNNQRQQSNLNTAWIDASVVYGSDATRGAWLRSMSQGKMKTSTGNLLPYNTVNGQLSGALDPNAPSMANDEDHTVKVFVAGDVRASEHPGILGLHTIFVREHNKICDRLISQGYSNDEIIYQKARKEIGALIQAVTYQEFLPALGVSLSNSNAYKSYVRPDIMNTFATASYRIGHTLVADELALRDNDCEEVGPGDIDLMDAFFNPSLMLSYGIEPFMRGFATHKQYETDNKVNSVLRNALFNNPNDPVRFGLDLACLNIQRGRDHGLPGYSTMRAYYTGMIITKFSQITSDPVKAQQLQDLYGSVNNIDLWVGILAEDRMPNKSVGKTMHAMLKAQFENIRDGDFYFYKRDPYLPNSIKNTVIATRLSDIIKRNTTLTNLQNNVFFIEPCPGENGEDDEGERSVQSELNSGGNLEINVYPNPVKDIVNIDLSYLSEPASIRIYNASGILVKSMNGVSTEKEVQLNIHDLAPGVYFMNVVSGNNIKSIRLVKLSI